MKLIVSNPHLSYVNTRMHRPSVVDDDASAPEGYWHPVELVAEPERVSSATKVAGILLAVSIGLVGALALIAWGLE